MLYLHELLHKLNTSHFTRPRPSGEGFIPVPVKIGLCRPGETKPFAVVGPDQWAFQTYRPAKGDRPERPAMLVILCTVPVENPGPPAPETTPDDLSHARAEQPGEIDWRNRGPMPPPDPAAWVNTLQATVVPPFDPPPSPEVPGVYPVALDRVAVMSRESKGDGTKE